MNLSTLIVLAIVAVLLFFAVRSIVSGNASDCSSCGADCGSGNCASCNATAKLLADMDQADRAARKASELRHV